MSSNVFFKFTSQRDASRVTFDGTSISVWELKREIITQSRLGDGTDFDLIITNPDTKEEYDDDTVQIPRSTSVTAKRARPAQGPGRGRAARYITGKMPTMTKTTHRQDQAGSASTKATPIASNATEDENIAAMFKEGEQQWAQQQAAMASATPVFRSGPGKRQNQSNNDNPVPIGYVCHRCRKPGHWIQNCPTNNDSNYDNGPRVKRTTGIPRSFLRTVKEDPDAPSDGTIEEKKAPSNIMINAEGQRVEAVPDIASWEQYKAKAEASAARKDENVADSKELEERGLACPLDKRLFVSPTKTPCCGRTYCHDCIENALADSDLVCPGCESEGVLFDNLTSDDEIMHKVKEYQAEKAARAKAGESKLSKEGRPSSADGSAQESKSPPATASNPKKRAAEEELSSDRPKTKSPPGAKINSPNVRPKSPVEASKNHEIENTSLDASRAVPTGPKAEYDFEQQMNELAKQHGYNNTNQMNAMPIAPGFPPFMPNMMSMPNPMMMMQGGMNPFAMGMMGMPNMMAGNSSGSNFNQNGMGTNNGWSNGSNANTQNIPTGPKAQRTPFSHQQASRGNDDEAYMRKPLNPHRAAHRNRRVRPMDFKEL